jgi:hypothetical protein
MIASHEAVLEIHIPASSRGDVDVEELSAVLSESGMDLQLVIDSEGSGIIHVAIPVIVIHVLAKGGPVLQAALGSALWDGVKASARVLRRLGHKILVVFDRDGDPPPVYILDPPPPAQSASPDAEVDKAIEEMRKDLAEGAVTVREITWRHWDPGGGVWEVVDRTAIR